MPPLTFRSMRRAAALVLAAPVVAGCARDAQRGLRYTSESYYFTVEADPLPPPAREPVRYTIYVRDRESRQPIETGEGQIYSSNRDNAKTWDGLVKGDALGTYHGTLNFVTSGTWAVAIRFRRDSTARLETVQWMQDVLTERPTGSP